MSEFGKVPLLVAEAYDNGKLLRIFRELDYRRNFRDRQDKPITSHMITLLYTISTEAIKAIRENAPTLLNILERVISGYLKLLDDIDCIQEYMPRTFVRLYEKLIGLQEEIVSRSFAQEVIVKSEQINNIIVNIMLFWNQHPEILFRLPPIALHITPELFLNEDYLPYTLGLQPLPDWIDPLVVITMNDARKIYQTKKQSDFQQDLYRRYLYDIKYYNKYIP